MGRPRIAPTERDRFWLDHEASIKASGQSAKAYAAAQGLSLHALYQSRKRRRALGDIFEPPARGPSPKRSQKPVSFSRVEFQRAQSSPAEYRLSLPNGLVLEWSGPELPPGVMALVDRLTSPR